MILELKILPSIRSALAKSLLLLVFLILTASCSSESDVADGLGKRDPLINSKMTSFVEGIMDDFHLPGLALGVVQNDELVYAQGFGYENIDTEEPVTTESIFHLASVSKPFVATAIMQLVERGKIDLDSTLLSYLPYFKMDSADYDKITIRQMLAHSSGMASSNGYDWDKPTYTADAIENYVRSLSSETLIHKPGEAFTYSNIAYDCLGDVIAKVTGMSFSDYMDEYILTPTGMEKSSFLKPEYLPENWSSPHNRNLVSEVWDGYPYNRMHAPSSTLHSNILEMSRWAISNLNSGQTKGGALLDSLSYAEMWKPWTVSEWGAKIGLSWFLESHNDIDVIGHSGGDTGFSSEILLVPEYDLAVIVLINQSPSPFEIVSHGAIDIMLGNSTEPYKIPAVIPFGKKMKEEGIGAAGEYWNAIFRDSTDRYAFSVHQLKNLSRKLLRNDRPQEAREVIEFNISSYPDEAVNIDMLGDFFLSRGDTLRAIENYKEALEINPDFNRSKKSLARLQSSN